MKCERCGTLVCETDRIKAIIKSATGAFMCYECALEHICEPTLTLDLDPQVGTNAKIGDKMRKFIAGVILGASLAALGAYNVWQDSATYTKSEQLQRYEAELGRCEQELANAWRELDNHQF